MCSSYGGPGSWPMDLEIVVEAAIVASWPQLPSHDVDECADWLKEAMHNICDASMPHVGPHKPRRQTYWWRPELFHLRQECNAARRRYTRYRRRRNRDQQEEEALHEAYRAARLTFRDAALGAKANAWRAFEEDPWTRYQKSVRRKLRPVALPIVQTVELEFRNEVASVLFPPGTERSPPSALPTAGEREVSPVSGEREVTPAELAAAVLGTGRENTATGREGEPGRAWILAMKELEPRLLTFLTDCLVQGRVPRQWTTDRVVLLRKTDRPEDRPAVYRPVVLLDEMCKILERVLLARLVRHLEGGATDCRSARSARSTPRSVVRLRDVTEEEVRRGGRTLTSSLDTSNARDCPPWSTIEAGLRHRGVPGYLRKTIGSYLSERWVQLLEWR